MPGVTTDDTATTREGADDQGLVRAIGPKLLVFFIIGDILGTTIYALTGTVSERVGGALWLPFLLAFVVAFMTAFSYLELVGKYPRAAGAALYTQQAFGRPFLTFLVAFTVMCSGITSAASAAQAFGGRNLEAIVGELPGWVTPLVVVAFLVMLAGHQLPGCRRVGQGQRRPHGDRDPRPAHRHRARGLGRDQRDGRRLAPG